MKITVLTEAGPGVGFGHVRRCQALATALRHAGANVDIVIAGHESGWTHDFDQARRDVAARQSDVVVVDSYAAMPAFLSGLRASAPGVAVIDDLGDRALPVHLVVNGAYHARGLPYRADADSVLLLGPEYALLDPAFATPFTRSPARDVRRALVTLGGDAPAELLGAAVAAVLRAAPRAAVDVVVGPFSTARVMERERVQVHRGLESLRDLMLQSNLAVTGGGMTLYECLATGTPVVGVCLADNQRPNLEHLSAAGLIASGVPSLVDAVVALVRDVERRSAMSRRGCEVIDGRGAQRVADAIVQMTTSMTVARRA